MSDHYYFAMHNRILVSNSLRQVLTGGTPTPHPLDVFGDEFVATPDGERTGWFFVLLLAIASECNQDGYLRTPTAPLLPAALAIRCHVTLEDFTRRMDVLKDAGMISKTPKGYHITNWTDYQPDPKAVDKKRKEDNARQKNKRAKDAICDAHGNVPITNPDAVAEIIKYYNSLAGTNMKTTNGSIGVIIQNRINAGATVEEIKRVIAYKDQTWNGDLRKNFTLPTMLSDINFSRYLDESEGGVPADKNAKKKGPENTSFNDFQQRDYDYDALEAKLLNK